MDPLSNRLIRLHEDDVMYQAGFERVPLGYERAAALALGDKQEVTISRKSGGKMSKLMAKRRKEIAKESKRRNRK